MQHPLLSEIPQLLLDRRAAPAADRARARSLIDWCENHNFRPTAADLDDERRRRTQERNTP